MPRHEPTAALPWIQAGEPLPPVTQAWGAASPAPGLLAAGQDLSAARLLESYSHGVFPWFSPGQPVLWWSPDPRMVLQTDRFRFHRSLRKSLQHWLNQPQFSLCFDRDFPQVIRRCASAPRAGQSGTWIVPEMQRAYGAAHREGFAHSVETWVDGELAGCGAMRPLADCDYANACEMKRLFVRRAFRRFGLGRVLAVEEPQRWAGVVDLDPFHNRPKETSLVDRRQHVPDLPELPQALRHPARLHPVAFDD